MTDDAPGVARQYVDEEIMEHWKAAGWSEHQIRHWISTQYAPRDEKGKIIRPTRKGMVMTEEKHRRKIGLNALIADRDD